MKWSRCLKPLFCELTVWSFRLIKGTQFVPKVCYARAKPDSPLYHHTLPSLWLRESVPFPFVSPSVMYDYTPRFRNLFTPPMVESARSRPWCVSQSDNPERSPHLPSFHVSSYYSNWSTPNLPVPHWALGKFQPSWCGNLCSMLTFSRTHDPTPPH